MTPIRVVAQPLSAAAFAPFGQVIEAPPHAGREPTVDALSHDDRPVALSTSTVEPDQPPIRIDQLERHPHSSQTFIPLAVGRWLVVVSRSLEPSELRAFVAGPGTGVTIARGIWHHRLTALDQIGRFAVLMWKDGVSDDEFRDVDPLDVYLGTDYSPGPSLTRIGRNQGGWP